MFTERQGHRTHECGTWRIRSRRSCRIRGSISPQRPTLTADKAFSRRAVRLIRSQGSKEVGRMHVDAIVSEVVGDLCAEKGGEGRDECDGGSRVYKACHCGRVKDVEGVLVLNTESAPSKEGEARARPPHAVCRGKASVQALLSDDDHEEREDKVRTESDFDSGEVALSFLP